MFKYIIFLTLTLTGLSMSQELDFANRLYYEYENYKEPTLTNRRFKHSDIMPLIEQLKSSDIFTVEKVGESVENRSINLITVGHGKTKVFLWSQMHGDESTATMALFDIFNFLSADDGFNNFRHELFDKCTIYFMPMVNPDGAQLFQRRNLYDIDLNRDAIRQQTPEGRVLREVFDTLKADFGFNLHDQDTHYAAGHGFQSATLSFLAPATDFDKDVNDVRKAAMQVIGKLYSVLSSFIPGHIAKYDDDFEPRAFGDNFQKWGTSTILIESGGWKDDTEKQFIRKLNFMGMLTALKTISVESYKKENLETYDSIPFNEEDIMDLVLRNLKYKVHGSEILVDIGINQEQINTNEAKDFYYKSKIEDMGDLSVYFGNEDYDLKGMEVSEGETYPTKFHDISEIEKLDFVELYLKGYTNVILDSLEFKNNYTKLPINIVGSSHQDNKIIKTEDVPNLIIKKNGKVVYIVINGFFFDIKNLTGEIHNGLIFN